MKDSKDDIQSMFFTLLFMLDIYFKQHLTRVMLIMIKHTGCLIPDHLAEAGTTMMKYQ